MTGPSLPLGPAKRQAVDLARVYPEPDAVYGAVIALRKAGHRVYRAGRDMHSVDGRRTPTPTLLKMGGQADA